VKHEAEAVHGTNEDIGAVCGMVEGIEAARGAGRGVGAVCGGGACRGASDCNGTHCALTGGSGGSLKGGDGRSQSGQSDAGDG
jgi:hypothetical protein